MSNFAPQNSVQGIPLSKPHTGKIDLESANSLINNGGKKLTTIGALRRSAANSPVTDLYSEF